MASWGLGPTLLELPNLNKGQSRFVLRLTHLQLSPSICCAAQVCEPFMSRLSQSCPSDGRRSPDRPLSGSSPPNPHPQSPNPLFQRWEKHCSPGGGWNFGAGWPPSNTIQHIPVRPLICTQDNVEPCGNSMHVTAWLVFQNTRSSVTACV